MGGGGEWSGDDNKNQGRVLTYIQALSTQGAGEMNSHCLRRLQGQSYPPDIHRFTARWLSPRLKTKPALLDNSDFLKDLEIFTTIHEF